MIFIIFISFLIILRVGELLLSKKNATWLLKNGAVEYGQKHYPVIVALHVLFFLSLILEYSVQSKSSFQIIFLFIYFVLLVFKGWIIVSLGKYWNTRIYRIQNDPLIKKGPYKYFKHPNYLVVILEIAVIPLIFHLYYTAIIFSLLNAIVLTVRIKEEDLALQI